MVQDYVEVNEVRINIIREGGDVWYPISFIGSKILLKNLTPSQLKRNGYEQYMKQFDIDYGEFNGGVQLAYCINEKGLKELLHNSKIGRLSVEQKQAMNGLLKFLGGKPINIDERFIDSLSEDEIKKYDEYIQDCIYEVLKDNPNISWQKCSKCNNYYPYHINFFRENRHGGNEYPLYTICKKCYGYNFFHPSKELTKIYNQNGADAYIVHKTNNKLDIFKHYINNLKKYDKPPKTLRNKKDCLNIIKYLYNECKITVDNLTIENIVSITKLKYIEQILRPGDIYLFLFGDKPINYPWKFPHYKLKDITIAQQKNIFNNYLNHNNIVIEDIYKFNYSDIAYKCGLKSYVNKDILNWVMNYYDNKYPAYKFSIGSQNYWKNKDNRVRALKYLIEEDLKLPIEKVPLYITINALRTHGTSTMYNICKKYYRCLWEWVNEVYPNVFDERDFHIHVIRNNFDSQEEAEVHDILKQQFKNVIYNARNTENTIEIDGMIPDWFVFTDNKVWIIEYFGIDIEHGLYNKRIEDYHEKTLKKIEKYMKLKGYEKIYLYPEDLKNGFVGLYDKLKVIV